MMEKKVIVNYIMGSIKDLKTDSTVFPSQFSKFREFKISLTELCAKINKEYSLDLNPTVFYAFPTPAKLAAHIFDLLTPLNTSEQKREKTSLHEHEPIAVVGMACRLPGHVNSPEDYWHLLLNGTDGISEVPKSRWNIDEYYNPDPDSLNTMQTRFGGFIDHPEFFDAQFFNINSKEATEMDPQQRVFLQVCWEALENANIPPNSLFDTNTGVIVGVSIDDYDELKSRYLKEVVRNPYHNISRYLSATAGRVSYFLGLHGPCYAIDVACASSLVATHNAAKLLQHNEADCVLVGGVNLLFDPQHTIGFDKAKMLAPDGHCKTFDKDANGYVRSEGCGVLVLKRLSDAKADGNTIFALIRGSAINQDGSTNGITAPNEKIQVQVIQAALRDANLSPDDIGFIEAHGTGTRLGDPIEFNAIRQVYKSRDKNTPLYLGSVKSNIGHLEPMAGIAGIIKVILSLQNKIIPRNLHFKQINPIIDLESIHAAVPTESTNWQSEKTRYAGVSSFSFIGTNGHLILQEAPMDNLSEEKKSVMPELQESVLVMSAKSKPALDELRQCYISFLSRQKNNADFSSIALKSLIGRQHFQHRIALIASSCADALTKLESGNYRYVHLNIEQLEDESGKDRLISNNKELLENYCSSGIVNLDKKAYNLSQISNYILPNYPFAKDAYFLDFKKTASLSNQAAFIHPLLGHYEPLPNGNIGYRQSLPLSQLYYFEDHKLLNQAVFPMAGWLELLLALSPLSIKNLKLDQPLLLYANQSLEYYFELTPAKDRKIVSGYTNSGKTNQGGETWQHLFSGELEEKKKKKPNAVNLSGLKAKLSEQPLDEFYYRLTKLGFHYGPHFQTVKSIYRGEHSALVLLETTLDTEQYQFHPVLLDGALQILVSLVGEESLDMYLPVELSNVETYESEDNNHQPILNNKLYAYIERIESSSSEYIKGQITFYNEQGKPLLCIGEVSTKRTSKKSLNAYFHSQGQKRINEAESWKYINTWEKFETTLGQTFPEGNYLLLTDDEIFTAKIKQVFSERQLNLTQLPIPVSAAEQEKVRQEITKQAEALKNIIYVPTSDSLTPSSSIKSIIENEKKSISGFLYLLQTGLLLKKEVYIVTFNTQPIPNYQVNPINASFIGFRRSIVTEYSELFIRHVDLDVEDRQPLEALMWALCFNNREEDEIAFRMDGTQRNCLLPRLKHLEENELTIPASAYRLVKSDSGLINDIAIDNEPEKKLADEEIEVEIQAIGLNFRDVLNVMNLYPGDPGPLGLDGSGIVTRVGAKVADIKIGTRVAGLFKGSCASHARTRKEWITNLPDKIDFSQGAAFPTIFMTAWHALVELAKLKKGQKVLIHAATGGVGLAAIQVAKYLGAEIYATAGNETKQAYLRSLGISHIYSSRSTDYAKQILLETDNQGVDVVLNSLSGEGFIESTVAACAKGARFCEIGKRGIWSPAQMKETRNDLSYHIIALDHMAEAEPETLKKLLSEVIGHFDNGDFQPIQTKVFPIHQAKEAFSYLQQAKQIGKVVISMHPQLFVNNAAYFITGGLGELGLALAEWMMDQGANHLVLISRREPNKLLEERINNLRQNGQIDLAQIDLVDEKSVTSLVEKYKSQLKGIFHAAGILEDALLPGQSWNTFYTVFKPKVIGALNLYQACQKNQISLDYFVNYSSITSVLGAQGQSNYASANSFLDSFSAFCRFQGLSAQTIQWGNWAEIGMAKNMVAQHKGRGWMAMRPKYALQALGSVINKRIDLMIAQIDWNLLLTHIKPSARFEEFTQSIQKQSFSEEIHSLPISERYAALQSMIIEEIKSLMGLTSKTELNRDIGFFNLGMDSLMSVDLLNRLQRKLGAEVSLPSTVLFDHPSVNKLTDYLSELLKLTETKEFIPPNIIKEAIATEDKAIGKEVIDTENRDGGKEDIAIIGMSGVFPGANTIDEFWKLLVEGKEGVALVPEERWDINEYYDPNPETIGKMITNKGGFISDIKKFDANFFNISRREAQYLDPQQRLLLEQTWKALEHANIAPATLNGSDTGVFVGLCMHDYDQLIAKQNDPNQLNPYIETGNTFSTAAGRLSYFLGLEGPCITLDTACSSSLAALHEAALHLQEQNCSHAIVAAANAILNPDITINFSKAGMLSPEGKCKTFDAKADGYVRSEGCSAVVLKRLSDAKRDKNHIFAVIKASGINQDGTSSGLTVPNGKAQEKLLKRVLDKAKLTANDIDYIECHGTGTRLGDPIEVHAIGKVYGKGRNEGNLLKIGSVKTNIGHLEAVAGLAGLIKVVLSLTNHQIPKNLNFKQLNPNISLNFPAEIVTENKDWQPSNKKRRAAISSFGFSGTNAHIIIEEAPISSQIEVNVNLPTEQLFVLSAKSQKSLHELIQTYIHYLENTNESLDNICYTSAIARNHFAYRIALMAKDKAQLLAQLKNTELRSSEAELKNTPVVLKDIKALAEAYLSGQNINWGAYYQTWNKALKCINLPNYCFDKQEYWFTATHKKSSVEFKTLADWCFGQVWEKIEAKAHDTRTAPERVLIIASDPKIQSVWQTLFADFKTSTDFALQDATVSTLKKTEDGSYHLDLWNQTQLNSLLEQCPYNQVIILCSSEMEEALPDVSLKWVQLLRMVTQALVTQKEKPSLLVFTEESQFVDKFTNTNVSSLALAPLSGFIKSLQLELPELKTSLIDVTNLKGLSIETLKRLIALTEDEQIIALRDNSFYVPRAIKENIVSAQTFKTNAKGTYLITGGLGKLGQLVTQWLIDCGAKHIVLTGRHSPSEMAQENIARWQKEAIDVRVQLADVSQEKDVASLMNEISKSQYPLVGIYHTAGIVKDKLIRDLTEEDVKIVLESKVAGSWYLHLYSQKMPIEQFVLFSSITSFLGNLGQANYAAANSFLDGLALLRHSAGLPGQSINWDAWEIGMWSQLDSALQGQIKPLLKEEGLQLLNSIIQQDLPQIAVWKQDVNQSIRNMYGNIIPSFFSRIITQTTAHGESTEFSKKLAQLSSTDRLTQCRLFVEKSVREVLGLNETDPLSSEKGFFDMGMDSIMATGLQRLLQKALGTRFQLKQTLVFDHANVSLLSQYLSNLFETTKIKEIKPTETVASTEPIAIIGMSCRFPGEATSPEIFWNNLIQGVDGIVPIPKNRWDNELYYSENKEEAGKMYVKEGGCIADVDQFDANFFNISPREAECMDPQQRLVLEQAWEALERSGINPQSLSGTNTGVFVGASIVDYATLNNQETHLSELEAYNGTGGALSAIAGRLSYSLGLEGPCMTIDTACSSSLVSLHEAVNSLNRGETDLVISAGVNLILSPLLNIVLCRAKMLSADARCKTFDASANGYVRSDGCGVLILKRLSDAIAAGDTVLALIRGSAVNQDGASGGLTVPNGKAQVNLMQKALQRAKLPAESIDFVEAHGTGTSLGDPIEMEAIDEVYGKAHSAKQAVVVGALKSNVGHLEAAAGIAGVIKTVLALQHGVIPANLHFKTLNPKINAEALHLKIANGHLDWDKKETPRYAAVSAFGFTGTNAHVILEEAPLIVAHKQTVQMPGEQLFVLSAKSQKSLEELIKIYRNYLQQTSDNIVDICYSAATGRGHFVYRIAVIAKNKEDLLDQLQEDKIVKASLTDELCTSNVIDLLKDEYLSGKKIDWMNYYKPLTNFLRRVNLPTYRFDRQHYWQKLTQNKFSQQPQNKHHIFLKNASRNLKEKNYLFTIDIDASYPDFIKDHKIYGKIVVPAAAYISTMMSFAIQFLNLNSAVLSSFEFIQPLVIESDEHRILQISIKEKEGEYDFEIYSLNNESSDDAFMHAMGLLSTQEGLTSEIINIENIKDRCKQYSPGSDHQKKVSEQFGLEIRHHLHWLKGIHYNEKEALAELREPEADEIEGFELYPGLIDSTFQSFLVWSAKGDYLKIPLSVEKITFSKQRPKWVYIKNEDNNEASLDYLDANGLLVSRIKGFRSREISEATLKKILQNQVNKKSLCYVEQYELFTPKKLETNAQASTLIYGTEADFKASQYDESKAGLSWIKDFIVDTQSLHDKHIVYFYHGNFMELVHLSKEIISSPPLSFTLITQRAFSTNRNDTVDPTHTQVLGFWKSLRLETNNLACYLIDTTGKENIGMFIDLIRENKLSEPQVIVRKEIYVPRLNKTKLEINEATEFKYKNDSTYLITGGAGGLGIALANHLISKGVKHLVLLGRSTPSKTFTDWQRQQKLQDIDIQYHAANISSKYELENIIKSVSDSPFPLSGIFHLAGVINDGLIQNLSEQNFTSVFEPKITGSLNLDSLSRSLSLDCFVMFSSIAAVIGNAGQSNYAAANGFMDGLAKVRSQQGLPALSVNLGPFEKVGMAADIGEKARFKFINLLNANEVFEVLDNLLNKSYSQVSIMDLDWSKVSTSGDKYFSHLSKGAAEEKQGDWLKLYESSPPGQRDEIITYKIRELLAGIFNIANPDTLDINKGFFEMGLDSLMAVELINGIQTAIGPGNRLSSTLAFKYPTIKGISQKILAILKEAAAKNAPTQTESDKNVKKKSANDDKIKHETVTENHKSTSKNKKLMNDEDIDTLINNALK